MPEPASPPATGPSFRPWSPLAQGAFLRYNGRSLPRMRARVPLISKRGIVGCRVCRSRGTRVSKSAPSGTGFAHTRIHPSAGSRNTGGRLPCRFLCRWRTADRRCSKSCLERSRLQSPMLLTETHSFPQRPCQVPFLRSCRLSNPSFPRSASCLSGAPTIIRPS